MLAKLAWRILQHPDSLMSRILLGKYCHNSSFLAVSYPSNASHGWRGVLMGCELLKQRLGKAIENGNSTRVWIESWLSSLPLVKLYGPPKEADADLVVADLLTRGNMVWNSVRFEQLFLDAAHLIFMLRPSVQDLEDAFYWQCTKDGIYSVKLGYHSFMEEITPAPTNLPTDFTWNRHVWSCKTSEKLKIFLWKLCRGALPLGANLQHRGLDVGGSCPHCNELETEMHLFFDCPFARQVWNLVPLRNPASWVSITSPLQALVASRSLICLPPTGLTFDVLPWVLWGIWKVQKLLVFETRSTPASTVNLIALTGAKEW